MILSDKKVDLIDMSIYMISLVYLVQSFLIFANENSYKKEQSYVQGTKQSAR